MATGLVRSVALASPRQSSPDLMNDVDLSPPAALSPQHEASAEITEYDTPSSCQCFLMQSTSISNVVSDDSAPTNLAMATAGCSQMRNTEKAHTPEGADLDANNSGVHSDSAEPTSDGGDEPHPSASMFEPASFPLFLSAEAAASNARTDEFDREQIRTLIVTWFNYMSEDVQKLNARMDQMGTMLEHVARARLFDDDRTSYSAPFARPHPRRESPELTARRLLLQAELPNLHAQLLEEKRQTELRQKRMHHSFEKYAPKPRKSARHEQPSAAATNVAEEQLAIPASYFRDNCAAERFVSAQDESRCFMNAATATQYAFALSKILFADSLHLYFKEQDPAKREWFHHAIFFRFPQADKTAISRQWKQCCAAANRHRPQLPLLDSAEADETLGLVLPEPEDQKSYVLNVSDLIDEKAQQETSKVPFRIKHAESTDADEAGTISKELEETVYRESEGNFIRYIEDLALHLFADTREIPFSEQDPLKKKLLLKYVSNRFPQQTATSNDTRCFAVYVNRNRFKILDANKKIVEFPFIPEHIEQEIFRRSAGVVTQYASMLGLALFQNSLKSPYQNQDLTKRNWVRHIVDKRFPTPNKLQHKQKWKSCIAAIAKNAKLSPGAAKSFVDSLTKSAVTQSPEFGDERRGEQNIYLHNAPDDNTQQEIVRKFEQPENSTENGQDVATNAAHSDDEATAAGSMLSPNYSELQESAQSSSSADEVTSAHEMKYDAKMLTRVRTTRMCLRASTEAVTQDTTMIKTRLKKRGDLIDTYTPSEKIVLEKNKKRKCSTIGAASAKKKGKLSQFNTDTQSPERVV